MAYDMTYMLKSTESLQSNCLHFVLISDNRCSPQFYRNIYTYNICLLSENKKIICISFINRQKRKSLERFFSPFCSQIIFFFQDKTMYMHSRVKGISPLRYFPIYFIQNHSPSQHSHEVIPQPILMKFSPLIVELLEFILISSCNFFRTFIYKHL